MKHPYGDLPRRIAEKISRIKKVEFNQAVSDSAEHLPKQFAKAPESIGTIDLIEAYCGVQAFIKDEAQLALLHLLLAQGLTHEEGHFNITEADAKELARLACEYRECEGVEPGQLMAMFAEWPRNGSGLASKEVKNEQQ